MDQHNAGTPSAVTFTDVSADKEFTFTPRRLVIAGLTGRDEAARQHHVDELRALGITLPEKVPAFWEVPVSLFTTSDHIEVHGKETSGEVEPVLICTSHGWYIAVGSDHTDRLIERTDMHESKAACAKPVSLEVVSADRLSASWGDLHVRSWAGDELYQDASLEEMMPLDDIIECCKENQVMPEDGLIMFLGTVPTVSGTLNYDNTFTGELYGSGVGLRRSYTITPS